MRPFSTYRLRTPNLRCLDRLCPARPKPRICSELFVEMLPALGDGLPPYAGRLIKCHALLVKRNDGRWNVVVVMTIDIPRSQSSCPALTRPCST